MEQLTKEEKNLPVTYGELTTILTEMNEHIVKVLDGRDEETVKLFKIITNRMVEIIDMLEQRINAFDEDGWSRQDELNAMIVERMLWGDPMSEDEIESYRRLWGLA